MSATSPNRPAVLIAGAGPTGLVLALWLKKKGISFRIFDKSDGPGMTSRALAVQARTLEFYRQLGIADALIDAGVVVDHLTFLQKGKAVAKAQLGALGEDYSPFPYLLFCSQDIHESLLVAELDKLGVIIERKTEITSLTQNDSSVTATLRTQQGEETLVADYLCGCDGAHSFVRHAMGVGFPGGTYSQIFFVADVQLAAPLPEPEVRISVSAQDFCIVMPIASRGSVRLTGIVPPTAENKNEITFADVAESVHRSTGLPIEKVNWFSSYHVHHRVAESFQTGRVFLAGDAAHIHSPAGGQGMNTGIGDAINLAWKLAEVLQGRATATLLKTYAPERMAFAKTLVKTTDSAFRAIASRTRWGSTFRAHFLPRFFAILTRSRTFLKIAFKTISQTRIHYRESELNLQGNGKLRGGDRLPWTGANYDPLRSLNWQIHVYGRAKPEIRALPTEVYEFEFTPLVQRRDLQKDALYLIRPDGHVAFISPEQDVRALRRYLKQRGLALLI